MINKTCKEEYKSQLGMGLSKATHLLKLDMTFNLLVKFGLDTCPKCAKKIENSSDLSLDHIKPWRNISPELFWDVNNVQYVHKKCNKTDRHSRKVGPIGTSWCSKCKTFLPEKQFGKLEKRWNGLSHICLECDRKRVSGYDKQNPRKQCPQCLNYGLRKKCNSCGYEISMKEYMKLRRSEGVTY